MLCCLPSILRKMSLWVTQPDQTAMLDLDAMMCSGNSSARITCTSLRQTKNTLETETLKRPPGQLTNVYVSGLKKKSKILKSPGIHFEKSVLV